MTPGQIKALIALLLLIGVVAGAYFGVSAYNNAIESNALLAQQVKDFEQANKDQLEKIETLEANRKSDAAALELKQSEQQAAADQLALATKEFGNAIDKMDEASRACARRTVPAAVDRLLTKNNR